MVKFYIDNESSLWDYDFKEEVAGSEFDDIFVLKGNRHYISHTNAFWYKKTKEILDDLDMDYYVGESLDNYKFLSREQRMRLIKIYNECRSIDDNETIAEAANVIYPNIIFDTATIRGYSQGDWQEVIYDTEYKNLLDLLEAWYFGKVSEVRCEMDDEYDVWGTITHDELWKWQGEGTLKENLLDMFGIEETEDAEVYESDGYTQVKKWKTVA